MTEVGPGPITPASLAAGAGIVAAFLFVLFVGAKVLPGPVRLGAPRSDGVRKTYKLTGLVLFLSATALAVGGRALFGLPLSRLVELFWSLFIAATVISVLIVILLYVGPQRRAGQTRSPAGKIAREVWLGSELNPTWFGVDLKMFAYQPSLIGLTLINFAFASVQYDRYGRLSEQMVLYQAFWWVYVLTHYLYEEFMLTTWDVIAERFGFMLVWGDLVLVPFFYSIGGWWLVEMREPPSVIALEAIVGLYVLGIVLLRGANYQKHRFKKDPSALIWGRRPQTIGDKILVSGFWGIGRKLNYTGDVCVYLAIAMTTGTSSFAPYLLPLWLALLLVQRAARDDARCRAKYGDMWTEYCARVRFRMVPFLY